MRKCTERWSSACTEGSALRGGVLHAGARQPHRPAVRRQPGGGGHPHVGHHPAGARVNNQHCPEAGLSLPEAGLSLPEAGLYYPEAGLYHPEAGLYYPEAGLYYPEAGLYYPEAGLYYLEAGLSYPHTGLL